MRHKNCGRRWKREISAPAASVFKENGIDNNKMKYFTIVHFPEVRVHKAPAAFGIEEE